MNLLYIISQIFVLIQYFFIIATYQVKTKRQILSFNTLSAISAILSFLCLKAYSGCFMSFVSLFRNFLFSKGDKKDKNKLYIILSILFIFTLFTYDGILSLMPMFATLLYTISIWQNNTKIYKKYGIFVSIFWIIYHIYVKSLFGSILEGVLLLSVIIGLIREKCGIINMR